MADLSSLPAELVGVALALSLGLLVGIERGWASRKDKPGSRFAGVRTFGLIGLAGGFAGAYARSEPVLAAVVLAAAAGLIVLGYWNAGRSGAPASGTASLTGLLTMAVGYLAGGDDRAVAAIATGLILLVLALRRQLHGFVAALTEREITAVARFGLIALVVLPLLPDTPFGPYGAWHARQLWFVVVLVSGFSLCGYLAAKVFGARKGLLATALTGSLVSSTAVTASLAGQVKQDGQVRLMAGAIALASVTMFVRVMILAAVLAPFALATFAMIAAPGLAVSLVIALWLLRGGAHKAQGAVPAEVAGKVRNPFDVGPALLLTALVMGMLVLAHWILARAGSGGLALVLAATGTLDVDSAIITMGNLPAGTLSPRMAGLVLAPPVLLNTLFKAGIAVTLPGWRRGWRGAAALLAAFAASGAAALALLLS